MKQPDYRPYTPYIDSLLKVADAHAPGARAELEQTLEIAWGHDFVVRRRKQPPTELFKQIQNHLRQTITLLERLEKHADWSGVCFECYVAGGGIAEVATTRELFEKGGIELPRHPKIEHYGTPQVLPADGREVAVNVKEVLRNIGAKIERRREKSKRGGQRKEDYATSVSYAKQFFVRHSPHRPSTNPDGKFAQFCELFFRAVSGTTVKTGGLDWHIREALKR
jgi:hypothetical protein